MCKNKDLAFLIWDIVCPGGGGGALDFHWTGGGGGTAGGTET